MVKKFIWPIPYWPCGKDLYELGKEKNSIFFEFLTEMLNLIRWALRYIRLSVVICPSQPALNLTNMIINFTN